MGDQYQREEILDIIYINKVTVRLSVTFFPIKQPINASLNQKIDILSMSN